MRCFSTSRAYRNKDDQDKEKHNDDKDEEENGGYQNFFYYLTLSQKVKNKFCYYCINLMSKLFPGSKIGHLETII